MSLVPLTKDTVRGPIQRVAVRRFHFGDGVGSGQEFFNDDLALRVGVRLRYRITALCVLCLPDFQLIPRKRFVKDLLRKKQDARILGILLCRLYLKYRGQSGHRSCTLVLCYCGVAHGYNSLRRGSMASQSFLLHSAWNFAIL